MKLAASVCLTLVLCSAVPAHEYTIRELPVLVDAMVEPPFWRGIFRGARNTTVASGLQPDGAFIQMHILRNDEWVRIGPVDDATVVRGLNNRGEVVGFTERALPDGWVQTRPFLWSGGRYFTLDLGPDVLYSAPTGLNDRGEIVGVYQRKVADFEEMRAFHYARGNYRDLGPASWAFVDQHGGIALQIFIGNRAAVRWISKGKTNDLSAWDASLYHMNAGGHVAGGGTREVLGKYEAFIARKDQWLSLGTKEEDWSCAYALNDDGDAVGWTETYANGRLDGYAFLYSRGQRRALRDLFENDGSWEIGAPAIITNDREICGLGFRNGQRRFYLLTPSKQGRK